MTLSFNLLKSLKFDELTVCRGIPGINLQTVSALSITPKGSKKGTKHSFSSNGIQEQVTQCVILSQLWWIYALFGVNQLCWTAQNSARSDKSVRWAANPTNPTNPRGREMCEPSKVIFPKHFYVCENFWWKHLEIPEPSKVIFSKHILWRILIEIPGNTSTFQSYFSPNIFCGKF